MTIIDKILSFLNSRKSKPLSELLAVSFNEEKIVVTVLEKLEDEWNQEFRWSEIERTCFKDGGLYSSDIIYIEVKGREDQIAVPLESRGGDDFFARLTEDEKYFPKSILNKAIGSTDGGLYCWPPKT